MRPIVRLQGVSASVTRPLLEALDKVECPVMLVCGETDSSIDVNDVHVLYREMKRRQFDVRIAVVEGADHCPHLERPDEFFGAVKDFLAVEGKGGVAPGAQGAAGAPEEPGADVLFSASKPLDVL